VSSSNIIFCLFVEAFTEALIVSLFLTSFSVSLKISIFSFLPRISFPPAYSNPEFHRYLILDLLHYDNSSKEGLPFAFFRAISTFIIPVSST